VSAKREEIIVRTSGVEIFDMDEEKKEREASEDWNCERYLRLQKNFLYIWLNTDLESLKLLMKLLA
jgi:hypothetical protein